MKWNWRKLVLIFSVVGLLSVVSGYYSGNWLLAKLRLDMLKQNAEEIQIVVENYAALHEGSYPSDIGTLVAEGYLPDWPENPFSASGERMQPLAPADPAQAGDFVYLPFGPVNFLGLLDEIDNPTETAGSTVSSTTAEQPVSAVPALTEVDQYFLVFYGVKGRATFHRFDASQLSGIASIDWDHVTLVLTAGVPVMQ